MLERRCGVTLNSPQVQAGDFSMRTLLIIAAIAGAVSVLPANEAKAQYQPWCAFYSRGGGSNCGFYTHAQCLANVSGIGGICQPNPYIPYAAAPVYGPAYYDGPVHVRRVRRHHRRR
jgi:hypothetical protein